MTSKPALYIGLPLGVVMASAMMARAFDTNWISPGSTVSAGKLKADLDETQTRLATLEGKVPPMITEWTPFMPQVVSAMSSAAVGNTTTNGTWRRVGDSAELRIFTQISGTPTGMGCNDFWEWTLPSGLQIDSAKLLGSQPMVGYGNAYQSGSGSAKLIAIARNGKLVAGSDVDCFLNASSPFTFAANGNVEIFATIPIMGWTTAQ